MVQVEVDDVVLCELRQMRVPDEGRPLMLNEERVVLRETRVDSVAGVVLALLSSVVYFRLITNDGAARGGIVVCTSLPVATEGRPRAMVWLSFPP